MLGYPGVGLEGECCDQLVMSAVALKWRVMARATYHLLSKHVLPQAGLLSAH